MSEGRLKPRFTAAQGGQLEAVADLLGLRPAQVAERLLLRRLSPVPLDSRELWAALARTSNNLGQLRRLLDGLEGPPPELVQLVERVQTQVSDYRCSLLGLSREEKDAPDQQPVPSPLLEEEP